MKTLAELRDIRREIWAELTGMGLRQQELFDRLAYVDAEIKKQGGYSNVADQDDNRR